MTAVHVLNGPNLNLLGKREPAIYGSASLEDIRKLLEGKCAAKGVSLVFKQSNSEGDLISWIQEAGAVGAPVILNAGAFTHTSIALYDAIKGAQATVIEVHLSNVYARESFRHHSYISPAVRGIIAGFGPQSYLLALEAIFANI
ncbi:MAG: type II 3-dehydroquinate dehydratase [Methylocystaceae bacterium]|jgi:3-dehydroquinate dehydratase II|nr:type II 3-dehydroquinate dehydratase [Methylocystaceae bacterium]NBT96772.1 type II 3-dehydroquinate dehydratase [Methylocystaceae bacterium]